MSNYTFIVFEDRLRPKIDSWLAEHDAAGADEVVMAPMSTGYELAIISRQVDKSVDRDGRIYFRGTAISYEEGLIAFGLDGWREVRARVGRDANGLEGEFITAEWSADGLRIRRDVFGNASLLQTTGEGYVAISDSLLVLKQFRSWMGNTCTIDEEVLLARALRNTLAGQQIGPDTAIKEIRFLPAGQGLVVSLPLEPNSLRRDGISIAQRVSFHRLDYRDAVRRGAANVGRVLAALTSIPDWNVRLSLSGGYDSRVVLAGAHASGTIDRLQFSSWRLSAVHDSDFLVANSLARRFQFEISGVNSEEEMAELSRLRSAASTYTPLALWGASLMGKYDGVPREAFDNSHEFGLTGIGAELLKGNWGWRPWRDVCGSLDVAPELLRAFLAQGIKGLEEIEVDPDWPDASEWYYLGYRNGLHGAAGHLSVHMTGVHPVQQIGLAMLGHSPEDVASREGRSAIDPTPRTSRESTTTNRRSRPLGNARAVNDLAILLSPEVAVHHYDKPKRNLISSYVERRLDRLGGRITAAEMPALPVFGSPDSVPAGPSRLSIELARRRGYDLELSSASLLRLGRIGLERLERGTLFDVYSDLLDNARWRLDDRGGDLVSAGSTAAKVAMLVGLIDP